MAPYVNPKHYQVNSVQRGQLWQWYFLPLFIGFFAVMTTVGAFEKRHVDTLHIVFTVVFWLLTVGMIYWSYRSLSAFYRFGKVPLNISLHPLTAGRRMKAWLDFDNLGMQRPAFEVSLICEKVHFIHVRSRSGSSGRSSSRVEEVATVCWQSETQAVTGNTRGRATRLSIEMDVPADQPVTSLPGTLLVPGEPRMHVDYYRWRVHVEGAVRGATFERDYWVEVQLPIGGATAPAAKGADSSLSQQDQRKLAAIQKVAAAELTRRRSPEQVWNRMLDRGMPEALLLAGLGNLASRSDFEHANALRTFIAARECADTADRPDMQPGRAGFDTNDSPEQPPSQGRFWDPLGEGVDAATADGKIAEQRQGIVDFWEKTTTTQKVLATILFLGFFNALVSRARHMGRTTEELREQLARYRRHAGHLQRNLWLLLAAPATTTALTILFFDPVWPWLATLRPLVFDARALLLLPFLVPWFYIRHVHREQIDLIKLQVADANGWIYSATGNSERGRQFNSRFGAMFRDADRDWPRLEDEIWGRLPGPRREVQFWSGLFHSRVVSRFRGNSSNRKARASTWTIVAFPMDRGISENLVIRVRPWWIRWQHRFSGTHAGGLARGFTFLFEIVQDGTRMTDPSAILRVLSPADQASLIALYRDTGEFVILFDPETAMIAFHGRLLRDPQTDFFSRVELDDRDRTAIEERLGRALSVTSGIAQRLD